MQGTITDESSRQAGVQSQKKPVRDISSAGAKADKNSDSKSSQVGLVIGEGAGRASDGINAIHTALAERVGPHKYRIWFKDSTKFSIGDGYLKIGVPNLFIASWIENHFLDDITEAAQTAIGTKLKITFAIDSELSSRRRPASRGQPEPQIEIRSSTHKSQGAMSQQTKITKQQMLTLDNFVIGPSNELAYNAARAVVNEKQCPFNPLFIHGGYGLGKTHLLQGICNELQRCRPEVNWLYMSAEDFTNQFVLALKSKKLEDFRRRIRQTDLLAIDDIHFLASKPSTQEEFLHTFNTINLAGKQVVLVSDAHPKMIGQLSEKLGSRFVSGMVVKIEPPDCQTRCEICRQYVAQLSRENSNPSTWRRTGLKTQNAKFLSAGRTFPESVIKYIAENVRSNVRELEGAILKLIAYSALQNEKVTILMAQAILADHLERCDPMVHISDIESTVAAYFGITTTSLHSSKKDRTVSLARHFSMYLTRKHTKMSSCEIGRFMGNKNHATVLLACKKIEELIKQNANVNWQGPNGNKIAEVRTILACLEENISK
jgi:chromosomal replication initiator protein